MGAFAKFGLNRYRAKILFQLLFFSSLFIILANSFLFQQDVALTSDFHPTILENDFLKSINNLEYSDYMANNRQSDSAKISPYFYTYWSQGHQNIPDLIKRAIISWKVHNPDSEIILITILNAEELVASIGLSLPSNFYSISAQYQADWTRLAFLAKRGGVWIDASIFMNDSIQPLIDVQEKEGTGGFMFYLGGWTQIPEYLYFENWFIASTPANPTISAWLEEFTYCFQNHSMKDSYLGHLKLTYGNDAYNKLVQGNVMPSYLKQHIALQKVMQLDGMRPFSSIEAADRERGPLAVADISGWNEEAMVKLIMLSKWTLSIPPYLKLRNFDRKWILVMQHCNLEHYPRLQAIFHDALYKADHLGWFVIHIFKFLWYAGPGCGAGVNTESLYCLVVNPDSAECKIADTSLTLKASTISSHSE